MKTKLLTLAEFSASWWWNRLEIKKGGVPGVDWRLSEIAARNYELMRRAPGGHKFNKSYLELDRESRTIAAKLWVNWAEAPYRFVTDPKQFNEVGWTPFYEHQKIQWNLKLADSILMDQFIREIQTHRAIQKIPAPPHPNKGKRHRGVSWKPVEVLDRKLNDIGQLDDTDRHIASVAKRDAAKYFTEYERALKKWQNQPNPAFSSEETHHSYFSEEL